ncbi:hypothetical protein BDW74DRAFT_100290 [Aspergillus multicolor]|uniref:RanBP1 domain protein n=1 Tax=Aspergillus multicolor TaxID=41759 RepID=UPI003CCCF2D5
MSKRSAQGPQGDKDTDLFKFNMSSTPDDKPQRATAAQLAARKIKDVRRRPRAGTPSSSAGASFSTPFNSIDPNTVSSPSAAQQPMTNGFSFGQSQSFPPASPAPKPPAQNGGSQFAFGSGGGGSSTFNFSSASFGGTASTPASNPFASMNTAATTSQQPQASSFSGFKGNLFNVPSTGSQSPAQQSLPSGGLFGAGPQQSGPTGGLFGSTANGGLSSQPAKNTPTNGSIFGQSTTGGSSSNVFAPSGADKPNPFAQNASFGDDSMQTSPDSKSAPQKSSIFGGGSGGFGVSTSFGAPGTGNLFGSTTGAPAQTPSKPLFGAKPAEQTATATPSLFGASTQPTPSTSAAPSFSAAPLTTSTTSSSLFSTSTPNTAAAGQNPFQTTSLFGAPTPSTTQKPAEEKAKEEAKPSASTPSQPSFSFSSTTSGPSLFSQSATAAPTQSDRASQPVSTGSLFTPRPAASTEQEKPQSDGANPFNTLFQKPAAPAAEAPEPEQKPFASSSFFAKPAPSDAAKTNEPFKAATSASPFSASTLGQPLSSTPPSPAFSFSASKANSSAPPPPPASASVPASQSPFNVNGSKSDIAPASPSTTPSTTTLSFGELQPAKLPSGLDKDTKEGVEIAHRVRLLNECFQREVTKLDAKTNDFDHLLQFYLRVRETIGAPVAGTGIKRKAPVDTNGALDVQSPKKAKTIGNGSSTPAAALPSTTASSQPFNGLQNTPASSSKRRAAEDNDGDSSSPSKRANGDSTTASIFASSFSRSRTSDSDEPTGTPSSRKHDASSVRPSTPESSKPSLLSTTPKTSPPKPVFSTSTTPEETSTSSATLSQPTSIFKPSFTAPASGAPPASPFVTKPSTGVGASAPAAPLAIPKFGSGTPVNFLSQFKAQSDKEAEKEKEKRKAEEFDSDEDDEAEWARQDAEKQRKKREEIEAQQNRRAKFVPGQGFSFEDDTTEEEKSNASVTSSILDSQPNSFSTPTNIFGNLSAVPSENEHDAADDTEEDSVSGDDDAAGESSSALTKGPETDGMASKANGASQSPAPESRDEGDSTKAAENKTSGGRSMFDRVEYDKDGKPKRQGGEEKASSALFGSSNLSSSFTSSASTPNPFASLSQPQAEKSGESTPKPAPSNPFSSLSTPASNPFGGSASATPRASTPSIFATGSSATKPGSDNTWKPNSPITFASTPAQESASSAESDTGSAAPASGSSPNFKTLFGAPSAGANSGSNGTQGTAGFSFGGPSQTGSSLLTPSVLTSASQSRASTPGMTSDTGAEDSADGDIPKNEPQVDLARGGAGEEDEDVVIETRARGLKMVDGAWVSQGLGFLRILKNRTTSRSRILLRADPSGNVVLNTHLMKEIKYTLTKTNIQFLVPQAEGAPEMWALRLKAPDAPKLNTAIQENKS